MFNLEKQLLTFKQVAEYLQISDETLKRWVKGNHIPYYRVGKGIRFKQSDLDQWLQEFYQVSLEGGAQNG